MHIGCATWQGWGSSGLAMPMCGGPKEPGKGHKLAVVQGCSARARCWERAFGVAVGCARHCSGLTVHLSAEYSAGRRWAAFAPALESCLVMELVAVRRSQWDSLLPSHH